MRVIILTKGQHTVVSDHVFEWASKYEWHTHSNRRGIFYAARTIWVNGRKQRFFLHREILNAPPGVLVDHRDGDGLNNLDENLRLANARENGRNRRKNKNNTSGFRGVSFCKITQKWKVQISGPAGHVHGGVYEDKQEAARAYDRLATKLHGEFACLNFPTTPP